MSSINLKNPRQKIIARVLDMCADYELEIVSWGLAPNPDGYCYEILADKPSTSILLKFERLLGQLKRHDIEL